MAKARLTPRAFVKSRSDKQAGGAWLVYGSDEYVKTETVRLAARAFIGQGDLRFAVTHLVGGQTDAQEILQSAQSVPMLGQRNVVIVHEVHKLAPAHKTRLADGLSSVADTCLLICHGPAEPDKRTRLYQWFMESGRDVACDPLTATGAETFARRRLEEQGSTADAAALGRLLALTGPDAGVIARETEKLSLYAGATVTTADVDVVAGLSVGSTLEDLVASLLSGSLPPSLALLRKIRQSGWDGSEVVSRISGHLFDLKRAAAAKSRQTWQLAGALRVSKGKAEELLAWLAHCREQQIDVALQHAALADRLVRSGKADADSVCDQMVLATARAFSSGATPGP
jgi:DNA polymerase-3 subunit delta